MTDSSKGISKGAELSDHRAQLPIPDVQSGPSFWCHDCTEEEDSLKLSHRYLERLNKNKGL